jgi:hypothetical protein
MCNKLNEGARSNNHQSCTGTQKRAAVAVLSLENCLARHGSERPQASNAKILVVAGSIEVVQIRIFTTPTRLLTTVRAHCTGDRPQRC